MKKPILHIATLFLSLVPFCSFGKAVDVSTARNTGCNYLVNKGVQGVKTPADLNLSYAATSQLDGKTVTDFYVFNINGASGFVLVSGDDLVTPVLAYSGEASFEFEKIAPAVKSWIGWYQRQIEYVIAHNVPAQAGTAESWKSLQTAGAATTAAKTTSVTPMLTTTWDQDPFYNALCPGSGSTKAVTGCVATAMAQVMKFWNWPVMGDGMHTYTHPTYGTKTVNFGTTTYQWSSMPDNLASGNAAVATLMYHCGVSVDMNYGTAASGGSSAGVGTITSSRVNCTEYALKTYFHYKQTLKTIERDGTPWMLYPLAAYTTTSWINALKAELDAGRPFIYRGDDGAEGHAWVCDGYQSSNNYMHFNWGWGGAGPNGYYSVDDVAPPVLGAGGGSGNFNLNHGATIGIQPDTYTSYTDAVKMQSPISFNTSIPVRFNKAFSFSAKILNGRTSTFTGDVCAQIFDASTLVGTVQTVSGLSIAVGDSSSLLTFSTTAMPRLVCKNYTVKLMYHNTGSSTWVPIGSNGNIKNYSMLDIRNDTTLMLYDSIKVITGTPMVPGANTKVSTILSNRTGSAFVGSVKAQLVDVNWGVVYTIGTNTGVSIDPWQISLQEFITTSLTAPNGMYALEIVHQYNGAGTFFTSGSKDFQNPKLVQVGTGIGVTPVAGIPHEIFMYPNPANDKFRVLFNDFAVESIVIMDMTGRLIQTYPVAAGASTMDVPVAGYAPGMYLVRFVTNNETISKKINVVK